MSLEEKNLIKEEERKEDENTEYIPINILNLLKDK